MTAVADRPAATSRGAVHVALAALRHLGRAIPADADADADVEAAVAGARTAEFRGGGQACTAANRFHVHASLAQESTSRFAQAVRPGPSDRRARGRRRGRSSPSASAPG